jgi:aromatic-ring opening dioxygenase LigAB LigA subunit
MSANALNIMLVDLFRSEEALTRFEQNPDAVAAQYGLSSEECERLKAKDMGWLYTQGGVHPYILVQYAFAVRYDLKQYLGQLQAATGQTGQAPPTH